MRETAQTTDHGNSAPQGKTLKDSGSQIDVGPSEKTSAINFLWFLSYKFFNSLFLGLSIGTVFILYTPLSPAVFSAGGIGLAIGTLLVATQYHQLFTPTWFFRISLFVELLILAGIIGVLVHPVDQPLALFVYIGYQFTFAFGSYLVRCETLLIPEDGKLTKLDVAKQTGYLAGMGASWGFYTALESFWQVSDKTEQVIALHWPLLGVELLIVGLLWLAFRQRHKLTPTVADRTL